MWFDEKQYSHLKNLRSQDLNEILIVHQGKMGDNFFDVFFLKAP